jgi:hypothetical protein
MRRTILLAIFFLLAPRVDAQSTCPPLLAPAPDPAKLLFTPRQEGELGEIIREQLESNFLVIEDAQVTAYLRRMGGSRRPALAGHGLALRISPLRSAGDSGLQYAWRTRLRFSKNGVFPEE